MGSTSQSSNYVFHSASECERLERQNALLGIERHLRHFKLSPGACVLDAGCGSGAIARLVASHHPETKVVGVDVNPDYVSWAANQAATEGLKNLEFQSGDVRSLPFADASFDVVWSQMVLYYVPNPQAAVDEFRRLLRPGGTLIVSIIDNLLGTNFPEDPALQPRLQKVIPGLADILIARKLPLMLRKTSFEDIRLEIEMDPVFTTIGSIAPDHRQNFEVGLTAGISRIVEVLGSRAEAETFLNDVLAYLDRSDTCTYSTLWIVKGVAGSARS